VPDSPRHHELCFGCGQANLFGLQLELERRADGSVEGRFFVKQDHQGTAGVAHRGVLAAALEEAIALAAEGTSARLEVSLLADAPVGTFVSVSARVEADGRGSAVARGEAGELVARAGASFAPSEHPVP
jgi:acyl-coenzyme A thioesterase PaaI-like protein